MDIFITGGTGFVGRELSKMLLADGWQVTVLTRSEQAAQRLPDGARHVVGDPAQTGPWQDEAARHGHFVNLAGASIFGRWTREYKEQIKQSRIQSTKNLVDAICRREGEQPAVLVSTSAVGYYGFHGEEELDESDGPGEDFLALVCRDWEAQANKAKDPGARVVFARFGIVLGPGGGALGQMLPIFRKGLGGPLGSGRQWFSWIHVHDLIRAIKFCLEKPAMQGPVNFTAPQPVTNRDLSSSLGRVLCRPAFLPAPGFAVRLMMGEFGSVLLEGQKVLPRKLMKAGFDFQFDQISAALENILAS